MTQMPQQPNLSNDPSASAPLGWGTEPPAIPVSAPPMPSTPPAVGSVPANAAPPPPAAPKQPNIVRRIGSKIATGIEDFGAGANPQYDVSDTGDMIAKLPTRSLFRGIVSAALAALAGAGTGALATANPQTRNSPAQAFGVGIGAGFDAAQQKDQAAREEARQDFEQQQKAILQKADLAHLNASTTSLYFGMEKAARQSLYDTNNQTVAAFADADIPSQRMSASEANAYAKQTPGFFTTHIVLPLGMEPITGPNGEVISDKTGAPHSQEFVAVVQVPTDPKTHQIVIPQSVADDTQKYASVSGIQNAQHIRAGDEVSLDSYIRILTANQKAQKTILSGWQTAQKDPQKYLAILGTGKDARPVLWNPAAPADSPERYRDWNGPVPADLQATLDLKKAETEHDRAETVRAKNGGKGGTNPDLKNAKAKLTGAKEALADARQAAKEAAEAKYGARATAAIAAAVSSDSNVKAAQKSYDDALAAQNKLLGISATAPAAAQSNPTNQQPNSPQDVAPKLPVPPRKGTKLTDPAIAQQYVKAAGGDNAKARQLAEQAGWSF